MLLDECLTAKVADFGLSNLGPALDQTHVSTAVKGSFGYLDLDYYRRQQLTEKLDVYSFGVVLLVVLCARPPIYPALPREQVNIAEWAMSWQKKGRLENIIDPRLQGHVNLESLRKFGEQLRSVWLNMELRGQQWGMFCGIWSTLFKCKRLLHRAFRPKTLRITFRICQNGFRKFEMAMVVVVRALVMKNLMQLQVQSFQSYWIQEGERS
ncbi:hypothetical protein ACFX2K_001209 [Malus domestica]